jgi:hypothetical protein
MKNSIKKIIVLVAILLVLVSVSGRVFVYAQEQTGAGDEVDRSTGTVLPKVPGQDAQISDSTGSSSSGGAGDEVVRATTDLMDKLQYMNMPTTNTSGSGEIAPGNDAAGLDAPSAKQKWFNVPGTSFLPYTDTISWTYGGSGCVHPTAPGYWRAGVYILDGSVIDYMYVGYYNNPNSTATTGNLYRYTYTGDAILIATLTTQPGSYDTGYLYVGVAIPPQPVDNFNNAYSFTWSGADPASVQELCYIQARFTPYNAYNIALPSIIK